VVAIVHPLESDLHQAAVGAAPPGHKSLAHKFAERADAGRRQCQLQRHILAAAQQIQHPHILASFAAACRTGTKPVQDAGDAGPAGLTVALLAVHRLAERRFVVIVLLDRKSTRLNSSHVSISYAVFCLKKKRSTSTPSRAASSKR